MRAIAASPSRGAGWLLPVLLLLALHAAPADGQVWKKIKQTVKGAAESETLSQVDRLVRGKVRCVFDDLECIERAKAGGEEVVLTDDEGEVLVKDGQPISEPDDAAAMMRPPRPGEGAWANYDFVPGDQVLLFEDYGRDQVGDFPRRFDLVQGNWEIVEWEGGRYLRATANGTIAIPLPDSLPERFTVEFPATVRHGNAYLRVSTAPVYHGNRSYAGSLPSLERGQAGLRSHKGQGPVTMAKRGDGPANDALAPVRIMADGEYMKMYVNEQRVANAPNAVFPRTTMLYLSVGSANEDHPILIGPVRIAGGGRDLYDRLARDGRVATQGILFATGSDRIRPESTPTLGEIADMLDEHPDLALTVEGHTDSDGEEAFNQTLSEKRAAAVKAWLVSERGIDAARLTTAGFGESKPAAPNDSPEGKQQNRRVELVRR
ncbi:MAG TPA: OmpA family protein [Gemmatimonadaceae bacterium]|nr:OmpA family protein [Gemmatimonadaceae bacterium]